MLTSNILKGVTKGFPLKIRATKVENVSVDYNRDFIVRMLPRIEYEALKGAIADVSSVSESRFINGDATVLSLARFEGNDARNNRRNDASR